VGATKARLGREYYPVQVGLYISKTNAAKLVRLLNVSSFSRGSHNENWDFLPLSQKVDITAHSLRNAVVCLAVDATGPIALGARAAVERVRATDSAEKS
jgi:hypothetical protein